MRASERPEDGGGAQDGTTATSAGPGIEGQCHAPHIPPARPSSWHRIARPHMRPQPRAVGCALMRFLARAPDLALAMWAVFPMPRGNAGRSSTRINAGALAHGPLCRLAFLHPVLIKGSGGTGRFLCVFHAMHAQTRTVFCDPNRLFLGPHGKNVGNRTRVRSKYRRSLYNRANFCCFCSASL